MRSKALETTERPHAGITGRSISVAQTFPALTGTTHHRWLIGALALTGTVTIASALMAIVAPNERMVLLREDGIIETASAICLAIAALGAGVASAVRGPRLPFLLAGLIGLVELMDETSFGARIFGFQPPPLFGGGELDGFHDLMILAYRLLGDLSPGLGWLWVGLIFAASAGIILIALRQVGKVAGGGGSWLAEHALVFLHVGFIGLAQAIDVATSSKALSAVEEVLEFDAALLLLFYIVQQASRQHSWGTILKFTNPSGPDCGRSRYTDPKD